MKQNLRKLFFGVLWAICCIHVTSAQDYFPNNSGVNDTYTNYTAFTNAHIVISPDQTIKKGTLLIKDGRIVEVGASVKLPNGTEVIDLDGKSIYPSFIDVYSDLGVTPPSAGNFTRGGSQQLDTQRKGYYWNEHIRAETNAFDQFNYDSKKAEELRKAGFGLVNTHVKDGIVRGTGVLVALNSTDDNETRILDVRSAQYLSFNKSRASRQSYPSSLMGAIALLRQMYLDAQWYADGHVKTQDLSLAALNKNASLPQIFYAGSKLNAIRADKIGDEFGIQYTIVGNGDEYQIIDQIKKTNATFVLPLNFPKAYDVSNPFQADVVNLGDMRYWNQAPTNPKAFAKNNIPFAFTTDQLKSPANFMSNVQKAIKYGLDEKRALAALTTVPAKILGKSSLVGTLEKGKIANFLITSGNIFDPESTLYENWVQGKKNVLKDYTAKDISGKYTLQLGDKSYDMTLSGAADKPKIEVKKGDTKISAKVNYSEGWIGIILTEDGKNSRLKARVKADDTTLKGKAVVDSKEVAWTATKTGDVEKKDSKPREIKVHEIVPITYPNEAFGFKELPKSETVLFKNATVWTNEAEGILTETDVLVKKGKIAKIGKNLPKGSARVIDATGKHLTAGIIDEHTHIAATSVNEGGQNSSAEVTMEDVIDNEDINIYRNLAGGVTSAQILHGSANPIGGQSAIVKLKWGETGENMVYDNAPKFIKFALGENVKQSRSSTSTRFPQTRMGVEQLYIDYFQRAKEYDALKKSGKPYRKDLEMEVLAEILNKERFITCHSYVQSEINMLMKVAEKFNFTINTFTHILEGYKVADKMKAHGAGGSTFADWWAYKFEVNDAIPYNAAIMHDVGITTAINSDDREMSRRLNQEASKPVKYGGVSEEEAWKFVTLNPAKLLHIDDRVGSVKVGKDADLVLWSDHPLSVYAKAEKTMIDGAIYFDIDRDKQMRADIRLEKNKLIDMMLNEKANGAPTQAPKKNVKRALHCDSLDDSNHEH
ncbi:amidohydrolase family protein [Flavobacteriaceae bacterium F08102]|nr:amidohydrolase family protein [Flavobacteriaceae bacterium F08102]